MEAGHTEGVAPATAPVASAAGRYLVLTQLLPSQALMLPTALQEASPTRLLLAATQQTAATATGLSTVAATAIATLDAGAELAASTQTGHHGVWVGIQSVTNACCLGQ